MVLTGDFMIIEWLKKQKNFTETEKTIAQFFLNNDILRQEISARSLAKKLYVSPSTITRFCQKAGYSGFISFKESLLKEKRLYLERLGQINPNLPFEFQDDQETIAVKLRKLEITAIKETEHLQDPLILKQASKLINSNETICVYTLGDVGPVESFKNKLLKIGKNVIIVNTPYQAYNYASFAAEKWLFLLASYSGETPGIIQIAQELKKKQAKIVTMTSIGKNSLSNIGKVDLKIATGEKLTDNFGSYSTTISEMYLFDLLYSYCFTGKFIENYKHKIKTAQDFEKYRKSTNPLIKD